MKREKKITVPITSMQEEFLKLFAEKQYDGSPDNLSTQRPIHFVQTRREVVVPEGYEDKTVIVVEDFDYEQFENPEDLVEEYYDYECEECPIEILPFKDVHLKDIIDFEGDESFISDIDDYLSAYGVDIEYTIVGIHYYWEDVATFFTLQSAKEYLIYQSHNLNHGRTYTKGGGYANYGEYHHFWKLLMSMGKKLNKSKRRRMDNEIIRRYSRSKKVKKGK
jgi:hypothetical protein